jgi:chorismate mutase
MKLKKIRKKLDKLDKELVRVIAKRIKLIPKVAEIKLEKNIKRKHPEREQQVMDNAADLASKLGTNPELIKKIFGLLIDEAQSIEKKIIGK